MRDNAHLLRASKSVEQCSNTKTLCFQDVSFANFTGYASQGGYIKFL